MDEFLVGGGDAGLAQAAPFCISCTVGLGSREHSARCEAWTVPLFAEREGGVECVRRGQNGIAAEGQLMRVYLLALPNHRGSQGTALAHWREVPALTLSLPGYRPSPLFPGWSS